MGTQDAAIALLADYARLLDARDTAGWLELFAPDSRIDHGSRHVVGREALAEFLAASPPGVHLTGLPAVTGDGDVITCESPFLFVNGATGAIVAGWYRDQLTWAGGRLLFAHRLIEPRASSPS